MRACPCLVMLIAWHMPYLRTCHDIQTKWRTLVAGSTSVTLWVQSIAVVFPKGCFSKAILEGWQNQTCSRLRLTTYSKPAWEAEGLTDSIISLYRSLPSRVRSPTPAKTEKPPARDQTCLEISRPLIMARTNTALNLAYSRCSAHRDPKSRWVKKGELQFTEKPRIPRGSCEPQCSGWPCRESDA